MGAQNACIGDCEMPCTDVSLLSESGQRSCISCVDKPCDVSLMDVDYTVNWEQDNDTSVNWEDEECSDKV